jgi:hypothetical protein
MRTSGVTGYMRASHQPATKWAEEDIVGIRYQTTTGVDIALQEDLYVYSRGGPQTAPAPRPYLIYCAYPQEDLACAAVRSRMCEFATALKLLVFTSYVFNKSNY